MHCLCVNYFNNKNIASSNILYSKSNNQIVLPPLTYLIDKVILCKTIQNYECYIHIKCRFDVIYFYETRSETRLEAYLEPT